MFHARLRPLAVASLVLTTWAATTFAQEPAPADPTQPLGPTPPTIPDPTPEPATTPSTTRTEPTTILNEPTGGFTSDRSTYPNRPLLVTGVVLLGAAYGASAIWAATSDRESNDKLYYPVAGPWLALDDRDCRADPCNEKGLNTALLVGSGVLQGVGALGMVLSLVVPERTTKSWYLIGNEDLFVAPLAGNGELGAFAHAKF